jgi:hypothetical protein
MLAHYFQERHSRLQGLHAAPILTNESESCPRPRGELWNRSISPRESPLELVIGRFLHRNAIGTALA